MEYIAYTDSINTLFIYFLYAINFDIIAKVEKLYATAMKTGHELLKHSQQNWEYYGNAWGCCIIYIQL